MYNNQKSLKFDSAQKTETGVVVIDTNSEFDQFLFVLVCKISLDV